MILKKSPGSVGEPAEFEVSDEISTENKTKSESAIHISESTHV